LDKICFERRKLHSMAVSKRVGMSVDDMVRWFRIQRRSLS